MALASLGLFASEVTTILAAKYPQHFSVNLILVGAVVDGVSGSFLLGMSMAHAYAADTTNIAKRAVNFGYFQGALFLGIALGPGLGGYIIERTGNVLLVFYLAMASHGFFVLYVLAVLPESLTAERMERAREKYERIQLANREELERLPKTWFQRARSWNPFEPLGILWPTGPGSSPRVRTNLALLAATDTLLFGVTMGGMVLIMYAEFKFGWHNYEVCGSPLSLERAECRNYN